MGIIELPNNSAVRSKLNLDSEWSFQISVVTSTTPHTHISYTIDKTNAVYSEDKILIPVKLNGYREDQN